VASTKRLLRNRWFLSWLFIQLLAFVVGFIILYTCTSGGIPARNFSETIYWSTLGVLGFMFFGMAFPLTIFVAIVMLILVVCGLHWKKLRFLSAMALVVWGAYWVLLAYTICAPPPD